MYDSAITRTPRQMRTPITEASDVIRVANEYLNWLAQEIGLINFSGKLIEFNFSSVTYDVEDVEDIANFQDDEDFQEGIEVILNNAARSYRAGEKPDGFFPFLIAVLHAKEALKICESESKNNDSNNSAWSFIADARYWLGVATTCTFNIMDKEEADKIREAIRDKAAAIRHAENRDFKKTVFEYYAENMEKFKSKDHAAESMAGSLVPVSFRTVRGYITEYHKKKTVS